MGAVELTEAAILLYDEFDASPWASEDEARDENFHLLFAPYALARAFRPAAVEPISRALETAGVLHLVDHESRPWIGISEADAAADHKAAGLLPFADCGSRRTISLRAAGLTASISFHNNFETAVAGERFAATLEMISAAVSREQLEVTPTHLVVNLAVAAETAAAAPTTRMGDVWDVSILTTGAVEQVILGTVEAALDVLLSAIVTSDDDERNDQRRRLTDRTAPAVLKLGGVYDMFLSGIIPMARWERSSRELSTPLVCIDAP